MEEIIDTANDKDKLLLGARIDLEEFIEIAGIENGKFIKMIHGLIQTIVNFTLRKLMEEKKEAEPVIVEIEREKTIKFEMEYSHNRNNSYNLEIVDITEGGEARSVESRSNGVSVE